MEVEKLFRKLCGIIFVIDSLPTDSDAQLMIADADQNGSNFIPGKGKVIAIIVEEVNTIQHFFFEYVISEPQSCVN